MNQSEAAVVLAKAVSFDARVGAVTEELAVSWAQALSDIPMLDAVEAVVAHYADSPDRVMPGHIRARVAAVRAHRLAHVAEPALPPELSGAEYAAALTLWRRQVADGGHPDVPQLVATVTRRVLR